ncbi:MAG: hypothetical protein ABH860_06365 [bacterium]
MNRNGVMDHIHTYFITTTLKRAQAAVLFQDVVGNGLKYALAAKERGTPIVVVQHGAWAVGDYLPPFNHPLYADKICVWGTRDYKKLINGGVPEKNVALTGCPLFHKIKPERIKHKGLNIVFAPSHYDKEIAENIKIMDELMTIKGTNIYAKLLSVHKKQYYGNKTVTSNSFDKDHIKKCFNLLRKTDLVVSNEAGTFQLLAMYFNIPVIYIDNVKEMPTKDTLLKKEKIYLHGTFNIDDVEKLPEAIEINLKRPDLLEKERKEELLAGAGIGLPGSPVQKIVETIKGMAK